MHGILFKSLKDFVVDRHDREAWDEVRASADVAGKVYLPIDTYDDGELQRLVEAVSDRTGQPVPELLEVFGRYASAQLLETYRNVVDEENALDLIAGRPVRRPSREQIEERAVVVEGWRPQTAVDVGEPARPHHAVGEGASHGGTPMQMEGTVGAVG